MPSIVLSFMNLIIIIIQIPDTNTHPIIHSSADSFNCAKRASRWDSSSDSLSAMSSPSFGDADPDDTC